MEFLTTPDIGVASKWAATNAIAAQHTPSVAHVTTARSGVAVPSSHAPQNANPTVTNPSNVASNPSREPTPAHAPQHPSATPQVPTSGATPYFANLDRAGIKNSFQSLFSPSPNVATPALLSRPAASGITPFINGMQTPGLVAPTTAMLSSYPPMRSPHAVPTSSPNHDAVLNTPYLQAAAKEAVRREFMNMPSYVTSNDMSATPGERLVPGNEYGTPVRPPMQVMTTTGSTAPSPVHTAKASPENRDAKVPTSSSPQTVPQAQKPSSPEEPKLLNKDERHPSSNQQVPLHPYFVHHTQPPPNVVMIGQHGMMMAPPPGAMYAPPPGVMMIPGGQPMMPQGMMMSAPHSMVPQAGPPVKPETSAERKSRIEHEKQELIREFKKKTREAALVRFRQKRRERRFGKLIRYDCRKKLADARPRVKGRFVRIKADEDDMSESPQVVPNMER